MKSKGIKRTTVNVAIAVVLASSARADETIRSVQQTLKNQGVYYGSITGDKSAETTAAIRRYQIRNGLQVTGELSPETLDALKNSNSTASTQVASKPAAIQSKPAERDETLPLSGDSPRPRTEPDRQLNTNPDWSAAYYQSVPRGVDARMVAEAQRQLLMRGYYRGRIDGRHGRGTAIAVRAFQLSAALPPSGRLDTSTLNALGITDENLGSLDVRSRSFETWVPLTKFKHGKWKVKWHKYRREDAGEYADENHRETGDVSWRASNRDYYNR